MSSFKQSYKGVGELLRADFIEANMLARSLRVKAAAEAAAPVAKKGKHRGRYKRSFRASSGIRDGKRACGRVVNTAPEAIYVEFDARHRRRVLGNALEAARD